MRNIRPIVAAAVGAALLLSACGSAPESPPGEAEQGQSPAAEEEAPEETGPTASCEDEAGDATASVISGFDDPAAQPEQYEGEIPAHVDLRRVDLSISEESVTVAFEADGPLPNSGGGGSPLSLVEFRVGVIVDGQIAYLLNFNEEGFAHVFDFSVGEFGSGSVPPGATAEVEGNRATLSLPLAAVPQMDGEFHWFAVGQAREDKDPEEKQARTSDSCPNLTDQERDQLTLVDQEVPAKILDKLELVT